MKTTSHNGFEFQPLLRHQSKFNFLIIRLLYKDLTTIKFSMVRGPQIDLTSRRSAQKFGYIFIEAVADVARLWVVAPSAP